MKPVRVAISGFGRIGRLAFRQMFGSKDFEIAAINNRTSEPKMLAHLLKYDTAQGRYKLADKVSYSEDGIIIGNEEIKIFSESKDLSKLPWREMDIDIVLECTGAFLTKESASGHLRAGAKKVVLSAPAKDDMPTVVFGVNEKSLTKTDNIISAASCTTNCLAPMAKALNDLCGIEKGFMTTIHAYTGDQNTLDAPHAKGDLRRARAAAANIVPNSTGAAKAIGLVIPELKGKLDGSAQRVPVATGSITELVAVVKRAVTDEEINAYMKSVADESYGYTEEHLVSSDIIGMEYGSLFDASQTKAAQMDGRALVKVAAWYDNEMSYTCQMLKTMKYLARL